MRKQISLVLLMTLIANIAISQSEKDEAAKFKRLAAENQMKAEAAEGNAQRLRYHAISIAMANRSKVIHDKELAGLVALQAYKFNMTHGGYTYENAVFTGLVIALSRFDYEHKSKSEFPTSQLKEVAEIKVDISDPNGKIIIKRKEVAISTLWGHLAKVNKLIFTNTGNFMATLDGNGLVLIWNLIDNSKEPLSIRLNKDRAVQNLEFSTDGAELRVTLSNSVQQIWSINSDLLAAELEKFLTRNLSKQEWEFYVAPDLPYEKTVKNRPEGSFDRE